MAWFFLPYQIVSIHFYKSGTSKAQTFIYGGMGGQCVDLGCEA